MDTNSYQLGELQQPSERTNGRDARQHRLTRQVAMRRISERKIVHACSPKIGMLLTKYGGGSVARNEHDTSEKKMREQALDKRSKTHYLSRLEWER